MSNYSPESSEIEARLDDAESQPGRPGPRRRGRRGGRRRNNRVEDLMTSDGMTEPLAAVAASDEHAVSQQLFLLMSPKLVKAEWKTDSTEAADPQLTYRPPATIESFGARPAEAPVSAATFKKSESPLQAVVATMGSMAILAALYHFGYYEGSQTPPERQQYEAAATVPARRALLPDPLPIERSPALTDETAVASVSPVLQTPAPPLLEDPPPPIAEPVARPKPVPTPQLVVSPQPSGLYLQVAALKDRAAARDLELELRTAGFETEILSPSDDGLIRVVSGPYGQRDEARTVAKKMSEWGVQPFLRRF